MQCRVIELTQGYVAIISAHQYRRVNRHSWRVTFSAGNKKALGLPYARATIKGKEVYLHRFLMNVTDRETHVDHKNTQTLDCRDENLEVCHYTENLARRVKRRNDRKRRKKGERVEMANGSSIDFVQTGDTLRGLSA